MSNRCTIEGYKIFANGKRLELDSNKCIVANCRSLRSNQVSEESESMLFIMADDNNNLADNEKKQHLKKIKQVSKATKTPKVKFHPLNCARDTSCISRDLSRCIEHNQKQNAEAFNCKEYYSNLEVFASVKSTLSYLNNEGGVSGLNTKIKQAMSACESSHESAELCCGDSMSCSFGGGEGDKAQHLKTITNMTQIISSAGGLPEKCNALKNITRAGTAGVMAFSTNCYTAVNKCHNSCKPYMKAVQNIDDKYSQADCAIKDQFSKSDLNFLFGSNSEHYTEFCSDNLKLKTHRDSYRSLFSQCTGFKSEATKANTDVGGLQAITEWTQKCEEYSKNNNKFENSKPAFNKDCTNLAHYSNPVCVQCRLDPSSSVCKGVNLGHTSEQASQQNNPIIEEQSKNNNRMDLHLLGTLNASDDNPGLESPSAIDPTPGQGLASAGSATAKGGSLGQDNIQALGAAADTSQVQKTPEGYNTNILGGPTGGGGYSYSSAGSFGNKNRITTDVYDKTPATGIIKNGFDLKEYLPGGIAYAGNKPRLPAGYKQLPNGEVIGPKHGNIFHMMHERYAYYESLGKFWPPHYSKEKIDCIKKSGILNHPPHSNQWSGDNLHKPTPVPNPAQCRHFKDHDPDKLDPTQKYLQALAQQNRDPQSLVKQFKARTLEDIYMALTKNKKSYTEAQLKALFQLYNSKYKNLKDKSKR